MSRCFSNLRFPIDKGKIKVRCNCGYIFIADPDDVTIYQDAKFDLWFDLKKKNNINIKSLKQKFINQTMELWYNLLNFKLLPTKSQFKIVLTITALFILLVFIIYIISLYGCNLSSNGEMLI